RSPYSATSLLRVRLSSKVNDPSPATSTRRCSFSSQFAPAVSAVSGDGRERSPECKRTVVYPPAGKSTGKSTSTSSPNHLRQRPPVFHSSKGDTTTAGQERP